MAFELGFGAVSVPLPKRKTPDVGLSLLADGVGMVTPWYAQPTGMRATMAPTTVSMSRHHAV
jgi:hypothetical protein